MNMFLSVAMGGAIGAVGRYYLMSLLGNLLGHGFPYGTIAVNLIGGFLLGVLIETSALVWSPSEEMRALIVVGLLGSFTTFSTFSLDIYSLFTRGNFTLGGLYIVVSVIASVAALIIGMSLLRLILT